MPRSFVARVRALVAALLLACLAASCGREPLSQLVVTVDSDLRAPAEVDAIVVRTLSGGRRVDERRFALGAGQHALPGSFGVAPAGADAARAVSVEVDAMLGGCRLFTYRASSAFAPGQVARVAVFLARECAGSVVNGRCQLRDFCGSDALTCVRGGACVPPDRAWSPGDAGVAPPPRPAIVPTNGSAIAITPDDTRAVAANRRANNVSVFDLALDLTPGTAPATLRRTIALSELPGLEPRGSDPEAWAVVMGNDSDTAFVALRRAQRVLRIDDLRGAPRVAAAMAPTGSEPTGLAITPSGRHLYVTNFAEGTVTVVATATMGVEATIDLNGALARSGRLGAVADPRPALAHPRAVVITNDGDADDADETAYVTEFFSQWRPPAEVTSAEVDPEDRRTLDPAADPGFWDVARVGVVYRIPLSTNVADEELITVAPVGDTHVVDAAGRSTGCFPNQLYAVAWNQDRLYVTGVCASPSGPVGQACRAPGATPPGPAGGCTNPPDEADLNPGNYETLSHATVFIVDPAPGAPQPPAVVMTEQFRAMYTRSLAEGMTPFQGAPVPDDERRRMPLLPLGLAFVPGDYVAYVLGYGSDAIFRLGFGAQDPNVLRQVGSLNPRGFIDLAGDPERLGRLPIGIAIGHLHQHTHAALVLNANTVNVSVLNLNPQEVVSVHDAAAPPSEAEAAEREGRRLFVTGTGRWSWRGQAWNSCETCHPDGLSDGVTWFFRNGPRQSPSLDGSFALDGGREHQRLFGWQASFDEVQDLENVVRNTAGGVGALVRRDPGAPGPRMGDRLVYDGGAATAGGVRTATSQAGLYGSGASISAPRDGCDTCSVVSDLDRLADYVRSVRAPRRPVGLDADQVAAGRERFGRSCAGCHGSPLWTLSRRFYIPSEENNGAHGALRARTYALPAGFIRSLNPALAMADAATFRYDDVDPTAAASNDSMQCAVRAVGTIAGPSDRPGRVGPEAVPVREVRQDMATGAQGLRGFNPPSLLGAALSAPYFHAGNARSLEELFDAAFETHHTTWCANCFHDTPEGRVERRDVIAFLLSIDDAARPVAAPVGTLMFDPDLCGQGDGLFP